MGQKNRNLAAKYAKSKVQKVDFVKTEVTKAYNYTTVTDGDRLTAAIVSRSDVAMVGGADIRRIGMKTTERTSSVKVGNDTITRTNSATKAQTMRQYLRSMF
jgi:hypothetical protein